MLSMVDATITANRCKDWGGLKLALGRIFPFASYSEFTATGFSTNSSVFILIVSFASHVW